MRCPMGTPAISTAHDLTVTYNTVAPRCLVTDAMMHEILESFPFMTDAEAKECIPIVEADRMLRATARELIG